METKQDLYSELTPTTSEEVIIDQPAPTPQHLRQNKSTPLQSNNNRFMSLSDVETRVWHQREKLEEIYHKIMKYDVEMKYIKNQMDLLQQQQILSEIYMKKKQEVIIDQPAPTPQHLRQNKSTPLQSNNKRFMSLYDEETYVWHQQQKLTEINHKILKYDVEMNDIKKRMYLLDQQQILLEIYMESKQVKRYKILSEIYLWLQQEVLARFKREILEHEVEMNDLNKRLILLEEQNLLLDIDLLIKQVKNN